MGLRDSATKDEPLEVDGFMMWFDTSSKTRTMFVIEATDA